MNDDSQQKGQGWHGDSEGHRRAGRKGGLARARNLKLKKEEKREQEDEI